MNGSATRPPVQLVGVSKSFGPRRILDQVTIQFQPRTMTAIVGPSGTGKTTLLNLIAGYLAPDEGSVLLGGRCQYLLQEDMLFSQISVADNMAIRASAIGDDACETADLDCLLDPLGLRDRRNQTVAELSGGERKRLQVAMTLLGDPDIVLMDEPTAALDKHNKRALAELMATLLAGKCTILATHDWELLGMLQGATELRLRDGGLYVE